MVNPTHPDCHNWELLWDDGVGQRCCVCTICSEEQVFHYDYDEELDDDGVYTGDVVIHAPYDDDDED